MPWLRTSSTDRECRATPNSGCAATSSDGARAVELGVSPWGNAITFASNGAKSIAVDPDPARLADVRRRAEQAEVTVQCLQTDLADLGDITSGTCDVVRRRPDARRRRRPQSAAASGPPHPEAEHAVRHVDRRIPYASVSPDLPYGNGPRTVGEWFVALGRSNFRVDHLVELGASAPARHRRR